MLTGESFPALELAGLLLELAGDRTGQSPGEFREQPLAFGRLPDGNGRCRTGQYYSY